MKHYMTHLVYDKKMYKVNIVKAKKRKTLISVSRKHEPPTQANGWLSYYRVNNSPQIRIS